MPQQTHMPQPDLPQPHLSRWQPLRLGLINLFHYDSEEFHFRDGHLLLRGNNGTGKSKVLSLTLPFLFDAQIRPSRIEPDGDNTKKMAWNLLLDQHERRMGYSWVEFGRLDADGQARYLTLGCGMSAVAARSHVDSWYFVLPEARLNRDLWLMNPKRTVLTRDRLDTALQAQGGQLFRSARDYRRMVDEHLFQLGQVRYAALMDTLVQLRQPQLSRKPDESSLSLALTEALPPMPQELLIDVAQALTQLEEYRRELREYSALEQIVSQFSHRYQRYAATQLRRQARQIRQAQTQFDNASRALNEQRQALQTAQAAETRASADQRQADTQLTACRTRLDTLRSDPAMADAHTLNQASQQAALRLKDAHRAQEQARARQNQSAQEQAAAQGRKDQLEQANQALADLRTRADRAAEPAGLLAVYRDSPLAGANDAGPDARLLESAREELLRARDLRQDQIQAIQQRCQAVAQAVTRLRDAGRHHDQRRDEQREAADRREHADAQAEATGRQLLQDWQQHLDDLRQLRIADSDLVIQSLEAWTLSLQGDNPARQALLQAQQAASQRLARHQAHLRTQQLALQQEQTDLQAERTALETGSDPTPARPAWQATAKRSTRPGAPFWQLVDFRPGLAAAQCAGLEAALQAAGLLDAWVGPDGTLQDAQGAPMDHDAWWQARPARTPPLSDWLIPAGPDDLPPDEATRQAARHMPALLSGIACGPQDDPAAEAWVSPGGRFRLGPLTGFWQKPSAEHIGHAARTAARQRRLRQLGAWLDELADRLDALAQQAAQCQQDQRQAAHEWQTAPSDEALRAAHIQAAASAREYAAAQERLRQAAQQRQQADDALAQTRLSLQQDAHDLRLPDNEPALQDVARHLRDFADLVAPLLAGWHARRQADGEWQQQARRAAQAAADSAEAREYAAESESLAQQAQVHLETLQASIGIQVRELQRRLREAADATHQAEQHLRQSGVTLQQAVETRARAEQQTEAAAGHLEHCSQHRQHTVDMLRGFARTGLLAAALPDQALPQQDAWSLDATLTLARRCEQSLRDIPDDDPAWAKIQADISRDYTDLGRALTALNHQAQAETSDFGLVVHIIYRNRPEQPDQLEAHLKSEIAQRQELLNAHERKVLETHLQTEISSTIQRRLRDAERQIQAINQELHQRPTTTGVRFRLRWEPLPEGADGAPVGLAAARRQLLNTSTDLWTAEDRRVVGEMLQQRIDAERSRNDMALGAGLLEQLSRALDYRHWHRFRVERWNGRWQPLSGPASSGERALGLTVPLFAAVSSFYAQSPLAPRLVLLDEVFAGIDDDARAHCWALIREFDLDFVITSEREWACSAELPGVAIAQLQRHEEIDAVHVSRWAWDGRTRRREVDPNRRFPPALETPVPAATPDVSHHDGTG
ncbi:TIGR02680 family protein [Castellaniella hirudinis]|uniref:TIGR02680 family protein n=1 Tax=Castellaniella hirudinis TaxID=1144617 RepID=UPI0039C136D3